MPGAPNVAHVTGPIWGTTDGRRGPDRGGQPERTGGCDYRFDDMSEPPDALPTAEELRATGLWDPGAPGADGRGIVPLGAVTYGEVLVRGGDYSGPQVNLASRLAEVAVPGETLLSAEVIAAVGVDRPGAVVAPAGRRMLKGIVEPVTVWSLVPEA